MSQVIVERFWPVALKAAELPAVFAEAESCLDAHRVGWRGSMLASDGRSLVCQFDAPDLESVRIVLRQTGSPPAEIWPCSVHDVPGADRASIAGANVWVTRRFDEPVRLEDIQALEDEGAACLERQHVHFRRTLFSSDRRRMICLYQAPDAESVRIAQREAGMPYERVQAFEGLYLPVP